MTDLEKFFTNPSCFLKGGELIESLEPEQDEGSFMMKHIICNDGFKMSVQASKYHYCTPRFNFYSRRELYYESFEVGFPSSHEDLLEEYKKIDNEPQTNNVFCFVPKNIIEVIIEKHGGINFKKTISQI